MPHKLLDLPRFSRIRQLREQNLPSRGVVPTHGCETAFEGCEHEVHDRFRVIRMRDPKYYGRARQWESVFRLRKQTGQEDSHRIDLEA